MKVAIYTQYTPWGFYRLIWPAMVLQRAGYDVDIYDSGQDAGNPFRMVPETGEFSVPDADVIVMQRVTEEHRVQAIRVWQRHGKRVVIDMDDNLDAIPVEHNPGAYNILHDTPNVSHRWTEQACRLADMVTASTSALVDKYGKAGKVRLLNNCVPSAYLKIPRYKGPTVFGWTGAVKFRAGDPAVVGDSIGRLQREGYRFGMVGPKDNVFEAFNLTAPLAKYGPQHMHDYPLAMSRFSVGIAPLKRITFNYAKSWLKPLEFLSVGVPVVLSDMPEYCALSGSSSAWADGKGLFYARTERDWYEKIKLLMSNDDYREEQSQLGRELVSFLTYENFAELWWEAWTGQAA